MCHLYLRLYSWLSRVIKIAHSYNIITKIRSSPKIQIKFIIMEKFEKFEIENQEMIFGGKHLPSHWTSASGGSGRDIYDTETQTIIYF